MIYVAVLALVLAVAGAVFYHGLGQSTNLRRNAEDIAGALHAGEQWRADLRRASAEPRAESDGRKLRIPTAAGEVSYALEDGMVWRQARPEAPRVPVLRRVEKSRMEPDTHGPVTFWRWELELESVIKDAPVRPLFTFQSVPPAAP
ncbi:MAG: hypothetical protein HY301_17240 [Verrucomicrobia bacterium]|nr:hypothetical protein [Verrucomicrobiota bacterium]